MNQNYFQNCIACGDRTTMSITHNRKIPVCVPCWREWGQDARPLLQDDFYEEVFVKWCRARRTARLQALLSRVGM